MRKFIIMDFDKWDGTTDSLVEGKKYYLTEDGEALLDDDVDIRLLMDWNGEIHEEDDLVSILFLVSFDSGGLKDKHYVFARDKKDAVGKVLQVYGSDFDNIRCTPLQLGKDVLYAD